MNLTARDVDPLALSTLFCDAIREKCSEEQTQRKGQPVLAPAFIV